MEIMTTRFLVAGCAVAVVINTIREIIVKYEWSSLALADEDLIKKGTRIEKMFAQKYFTWLP